MRKKIISTVSQEAIYADQDWLNMEEIASVEITSEDSSHPIESALISGCTSGWLAALPGEQTIRLIFDQPQRLQRIWLNFIETQQVRTHEFVLRWSADGRTFEEIVRQQWNFSPAGDTNEVGDYHVELQGVTVLELIINPDISGGNALASLAKLKLA
ncbi:MAG: carbohydrate-binding protein [Methyloprofundus sp.]|nr:carbohydrate-binding protein [Methyloprofundus sp.]MBW6452280.1 carbohydrate-binding protein [Methyloprofundus sp.]